MDSFISFEFFEFMLFHNFVCVFLVKLLLNATQCEAVLNPSFKAQIGYLLCAERGNMEFGIFCLLHFQVYIVYRIITSP